jgi:hypothetical protein
MKRAAVVGVVLIAAFVMTGGSASAGSTVRLCVPKAEERQVLTPKHGKCKRGYKLTSLGVEGPEGKAGKTGAEGRPGPEGKPGPDGKTGPEGKAGTTGFTSGELETLKGILPCIRSVKEGIGGKPTVQFSGCNVQIVNGDGHTESTNGEGNLVVGYDENVGKHEQTGSHNLILGEEQTFTSFGGLLAGDENRVTGAFASVSGGELNTASGERSSVSGGETNTASGERSSVSGGETNTASGEASSVSGGVNNTASGIVSSVSGGLSNTASGYRASVSGGGNNTASGERTSVSGGYENQATNLLASVSGGFSNFATRVGSSVSGGEANDANGDFSWIGGGFRNFIFFSGVAGENGLYASIFGGKENKTVKDYDAIP